MRTWKTKTLWLSRDRHGNYEIWLNEDNDYVSICDEIAQDELGLKLPKGTLAKITVTKVPKRKRK